MKHLLLLPLLTLSLWGSATTVLVQSASDISNTNPNPGDTLLMDKNANWADQDIELDFNGTSAQPIVLLAQGNGKVILSGGATLQIGGSYTTVSGLTFQGCASGEGGDLVKFKTSSGDAEYCRLTNCLFSDNNPSDLNVGYKWVSLYGLENRVDHCWFEKKKHRGTTLVVWLQLGEAPNFHRIDHNYFTRPLLTTGNNEAETIRIGDSQRSLVNSSTIVEYNYFEECDGEIESISNKSCYNVYRYNTFFNNASILTLRHGHYCTVESNYFFGNNTSGGGGVRIIGVGHRVVNNYMHQCAGSGNLRAPIVLMGGVDGFDVNDATNRYVAAQDCEVAYNTIVDCKQSIYIGSDKSTSSESYDPPFDCDIHNNIIYNTDDPALEFEYNEIPSFSYAGNIYNGTTLGASNSTGFTDVNPSLSAHTAQSPALLQAGSPAINSGVGTFSLSEDIQGHARTGTFDVGCDEYDTSTPTRSAIQKTEVGPCWMNAGACEVAQTDCHGDLGGSAFWDDCGVCVGGNTGQTENSSCVQDCNLEWDGTASLDNCGVCSGGSTGIAIDACLECEVVMDSDNDGNLPQNTLDNDLNTRWSAQGDGQWVEYCIGDTVQLKSVSIAFYNGDVRTTSFDILTSVDGQNWSNTALNLTSSGSSLQLEEFTVVPVMAWKIRIVGHGNSVNDWNSLTEVEWEELVTGTNDLVSNNTTVFPNPVRESLTITSSGNFSYVLQSIEGTQVAKGSGFDSIEINVSTIVQGIYLVTTVDADNRSHHTRIMKN